MWAILAHHQKLTINNNHLSDRAASGELAAVTSYQYNNLYDNLLNPTPLSPMDVSSVPLFDSKITLVLWYELEATHLSLYNGKISLQETQQIPS